MVKLNLSLINRSPRKSRRSLLAGAAVAATIAGATTVNAADLTVRIMTQNVYQGTNFDELAAATTPLEFAQAVTTTYNNILATQPAERAAAVASEIAREKPDLVGLQEVATLLTGNRPATAVQFDYIQLLQADLAALGQSYSVIAKRPELDAEAPSTLGFDVRLMTGDVLLARSSDNAKLTNIQTVDYLNQLSIPTLPKDLRGLASVDVSIGGATFRFATTHLTFPPVQLQQMNELISSAHAAALPLIVVGDFNADADNPADPTFATYQAALDAGFVDAWSAAHPGDSGFTCCQAENLLNTASSLNQRIDLALFLGGITVDEVQVIGDNRPSDLTTPSGLWPSDHAGLIATFDIPRANIAVPEASTWAMTLLGFMALGFVGWRARDRQASASEVNLLRG